MASSRPGTHTDPPPRTPSNLTASPSLSTQVELTWQDNSNNETEFQIERSTNGLNGPYLFLVLDRRSWRSRGLCNRMGLGR